MFIRNSIFLVMGGGKKAGKTGNPKDNLTKRTGIWHSENTWDSSQLTINTTTFPRRFRQLLGGVFCHAGCLQKKETTERIQSPWQAEAKFTVKFVAVTSVDGLNWQRVKGNNCSTPMGCRIHIDLRLFENCMKNLNC